jgi:hypothetical protein
MTPNDIPPAWANRAIRTRQIYPLDTAAGHARRRPRIRRARIERVTGQLSPAQWRGRRAAHERRVDGWIAPHRQRRHHGIGHPVEDFLFTYYSHRPAQLRRWHPGAGVVLLGADPADLGPEYEPAPGPGAVLAAGDLLARRQPFLGWVRTLLARTAARPAHLGCFGMHEWAMVYRQRPDEVRHSAWPLRLTPAEIAHTVERLPIRCSHFDAYRFFTPAARPLNLLAPSRERQPDLEQPGCLHATMDLYKWAYKLSPLVAGELVADCFALAREVRALDMRASPYDLGTLGYPPVPIETATGRAEYAAAQREFADRAAPLRAALIAACDALLEAAPGALRSGR